MVGSSNNSNQPNSNEYLDDPFVGMISSNSSGAANAREQRRILIQDSDEFPSSN